CRIGVDEQDEDAGLFAFVETVRDAGCEVFMVHARKAWLQGLSPKENRDVPPLNYSRVHILKREFPELTIVINGGIVSLDDVRSHLEHVDGVMLGRVAYHEPYRIAEVGVMLDGGELPDRDAVVHGMRDYTQRHIANGGRLQHVTRHMLGLYQGMPGGRIWRRILSENAHRADAGWTVVEAALVARGAVRLGAQVA
ncbi:MAG: tRNA-dihydrouridine synthase, partial [Dokdonella sp.]